jgi:hypothetical protein
MSGAASDPCFIITSVGVTFIIAAPDSFFSLSEDIDLFFGSGSGNNLLLRREIINAVNTDGVEV